MIVFIPHPAEALLLSRAQKNILSSLNEKDVCWYPCFPLWVVPGETDTEQDAASFRSTASALTIYAPEISGSMLYFPAELNMKNGNTLKGKVCAGKKRDAAAPQNDAPAGGHIPPAVFPLVCRIFRAADAQFTQFSKNGREWQVTRSFWIRSK